MNCAASAIKHHSITQLVSLVSKDKMTWTVCTESINFNRKITGQGKTPSNRMGVGEERTNMALSDKK
jgi:hypothetical protein